MPACPACDRLARVGPADPFLIASLRETVAILHKHQRYPGWCSLWLRDHAEHLGHLPPLRQARIAQDVSDIARAMHAAFDQPHHPIRINYENLGNVVPHIHWHLIPRRPTDPDPRATVWVRPQTETDSGCDDALRDRLVAQLRAALPLLP